MPFDAVDCVGTDVIRVTGGATPRPKLPLDCACTPPAGEPLRRTTTASLCELVRPSGRLAWLGLASRHAPLVPTATAGFIVSRPCIAGTSRGLSQRLCGLSGAAGLAGDDQSCWCVPAAGLATLTVVPWQPLFLELSGSRRWQVACARSGVWGTCSTTGWSPSLALASLSAACRSFSLWFTSARARRRSDHSSSTTASSSSIRFKAASSSSIGDTAFRGDIQQSSRPRQRPANARVAPVAGQPGVAPVAGA